MNKKGKLYFTTALLTGLVSALYTPAAKPAATPSTVTDRNAKADNIKEVIA